MTTTDRRTLLRQAGAGLVAAGGALLAPRRGWAADSVTLPFANGERPSWPIRASARSCN